MNAIDKARYAYFHDNRYHAIVEILRREIEELELTPAEVREIAMLACIMVEEQRTVPRFVPSEGKTER